MNAISSFLTYPFSLLSQVQHIVTSETYNKNVANTISKHFVTLTFKGCEQREENLAQVWKVLPPQEKKKGGKGKGKGKREKCLLPNRIVHQDMRKETKKGLSCL